MNNEYSVMIDQRFHKMLESINDIMQDVIHNNLSTSRKVLENIQDTIMKSYSAFKSNSDSSACINNLTLIPNKINQLTDQVTSECTGSLLDLRFTLHRKCSSLLNTYSGLIVDLSRSISNNLSDN